MSRDEVVEHKSTPRKEQKVASGNLYICDYRRLSFHVLQISVTDINEERFLTRRGISLITNPLVEVHSCGFPSKHSNMRRPSGRHVFEHFSQMH